MGVKLIPFQKVPLSIQGDVFMTLHTGMAAVVYVDCFNKTLNLKVTYPEPLLVSEAESAWSGKTHLGRLTARPPEGLGTSSQNENELPCSSVKKESDGGSAGPRTRGSVPHTLTLLQGHLPRD